jgi:hypothetical protein
MVVFPQDVTTRLSYIKHRDRIIVIVRPTSKSSGWAEGVLRVIVGTRKMGVELLGRRRRRKLRQSWGTFDSVAGHKARNISERIPVISMSTIERI